MRTHWLDDARNVRALARVALGVLALAVLVELVVALHPHFEVDALFGFHALFGFLACAAMIVFARLLGALLKRPDSYYEARDD